MTRPAPRQFTPEEDERLLAMAEAGMTHLQIAAALGRPLSSAGNRLRALRRERDLGVLKPGLDKATTGLSSNRVKLLIGGEVNCLGGCGGRFHSPDRLRIRICPKCKRSDAYRSSSSAEFALLL